MRHLLGIVLLCFSLQVGAQELGKSYKNISECNPISACVFCADPTALVYDGRLYVYGSNDHQQYMANGKQGSNDYGAIKSLVVFSTDDMVNWTFHGTIDVGKLCGSWGWRFAASWAPSVTWREGTNGKDEFFLYFANSGGSIGVLTAESPIGPWRSPLSQPMIDSNTPGVSPCNWIFDPGVVIDDNGVGWIAFGGGDPQSTGSALFPGNSRIAKLKNSMTAFDGSAVKLPAPYLFEASELNMMNGRYVYTYNTSWSDRDAWSSYDKRGNQPAPSTCSMCYMVTDNPLDPDAWEYRGEYVPNPGNFNMGWGNNHTHLQKFGDNYYLFYHSMGLEQRINSGASGFRSIGVEKVEVNESTQQINKVTMTTNGPQAIKQLDPYILQQAETMANAGGVEYEHFTNIAKTTRYSNLGNDASQNMQVKMSKGSWIMLNNVDFGTEGAKSFTIKASGTGKLEVKMGRPSGATKASVEFSSTELEEHTVDVDPGSFTGEKKMFLIFTEATDVQFDSWQFSHDTAEGISNISTSNGQPSAIYNISGTRLQDKPRGGVYIQDGKKHIAK